MCHAVAARQLESLAFSFRSILKAVAACQLRMARCCPREECDCLSTCGYHAAEDAVGLMDDCVGWSYGGALFSATRQRQPPSQASARFGLAEPLGHVAWDQWPGVEIALDLVAALLTK